MATKLLKPLTRVLAGNYSIGRFQRSKPMSVTLHPGDILEFREYKKRRTFEIHLADCFTLAVANTVMKKYRQDLAEYNRKKKSGYKRLRRPRKPGMHMFNETIIKCISK